MDEEQHLELYENLEEEFSKLDYPVYNPMEMASDLSDGSETVFEGENVNYPASKFATQLRHQLKKCSNEGFPYKSKDSLVEDTMEALEMENVIN